MGARGVSSEHVENMEMLSGSPLRCSPVLQLRCALVLGEPCSGSRRTVLWLLENCALVLGEPCSGSGRTVLRFSENGALVLGEPCSGSRRTVHWFSENRALVLGEPCSSISRIITKGAEVSGICTIVTRHASIKQMTQKSLVGF